MSQVGVLQPTINPQFTSTARSLLNIENDIEKRIKSEVWQKNIRVREFFYDFDRLRKGIVSEDKFRSAVSMFGIYMNKDDIEELIRRYKNSDGISLMNSWVLDQEEMDITPKTIRYDEFCNNIDQQFFDSQKAKENLNETKSKPVYNEEENQIVLNALKQFKHIIKTKRILLKQPFMDFDKTRCSHVTKDQFARVLTQLGFLLEQSKFDVLARRYMDIGNIKEVNYVRFCKDVDDLSDFAPQPYKNEQTIIDSSFVAHDIVDNISKLDIMSTLYTSKRLAPEITDLDVEKKIQADVVMRKIRISEFFHDFDGLRKGTVTETQFRRVLNMSGINLTAEEFNALISRYKLSNGLIKYINFVENIDKVFTVKGIDKDPTFRVSQMDNNTTIAARRRYLDFSEEELAKLNEIIELYRQEIKNRRVLLKTHFQDFDKTRIGHISKNQFIRILNQFGLFPNHEATNLLLKRYIDKGNLEEVNYHDFCNDVDNLYEDGKEISRTHADQFKYPTAKADDFPKVQIYTDQPNDLEDLLTKLRKKAKQSRIRISEFLRDFDKLRTGGITSNQLFLGFNMANLPLSNQEFNLLIENYKMENKEGYVRWKDICDAIDEVFTIKSLEKNPRANVTEPNLNFNYGKQPMTQEEIQIAEKVKARFRNFCKGTRLDAKQFFQDWDKLGRNKVSQKQFRQVLATVNFIMSDEEFKSVAKYYLSDEDQDLRYVDFINDTNPNNESKSVSPVKTIHKSNNINSNGDIGNVSKSQNFNGFGTATMTANNNSQLGNSNGNIDPRLLLEKVKTFVKLSQLRVGEYFKDYDPLRKGIITSNKFRGVLSKMKIEFSEPELQALESMYIVPTNDLPYKINYEQFIADVEIVFTRTGLEKDPLIKPENFVAPAYLDPNSILTQAEEERLHNFMIKLGEVVFKHRILIKPYFQDKDKTNCGKISFTRFRAILDILKLPLPDEDFRILCKRFGFEGKEFNYVDFIEVLKRYSENE